MFKNIVMAIAFAVVATLVPISGQAQVAQTPGADAGGEPDAPLLQLAPAIRSGDMDFVKIKLTMPNGLPILINRAGIIAFHPPIKGIADAQAHSQIRVEDTSFYVRETPEELAAGLKGFVRFTTPGGTPVWINPGQVIAVHEPAKGFAHKDARTEIHVHEFSYFVRETVDQIDKKLAP